jgi:hypothetical protein
MSIFGASFSARYGVSISLVWSSHDHLNMGPRFTLEVGLLHHGGSHSYMGPWFSSLLQYYGPNLSMGPWYMVVNPHKNVEDIAFIRGMECSASREVMGGGGGKRDHSNNIGGHSM